VIAIVDYGMGNLRSVQKALEHVGFPAKVTSTPQEILEARSVVLPGVGAFGDAMVNLRSRALIEPLREIAERGTPFLGICLGMQLLFARSEERGDFSGLGILTGRVVRFQTSLRVPHVGWNQIHILKPSAILEGIQDGDFAYFVHSYYPEPEDAGIVLATTDYDIDFASVIGKENIFGAQFHPEKSQDVGLQILTNFGRL
jgi:glutamine amidotransferase